MDERADRSLQKLIVTLWPSLINCCLKINETRSFPFGILRPKTKHNGTLSTQRKEPKNWSSFSFEISKFAETTDLCLQGLTHGSVPVFEDVLTDPKQYYVFLDPVQTREAITASFGRGVYRRYGLTMRKSGNRVLASVSFTPG